MGIVQRGKSIITNFHAVQKPANGSNTAATVKVVCANERRTDEAYEGVSTDSRTWRAQDELDRMGP